MSTPAAKPASYLTAQGGSFRYVEKSNPNTSNLDFLAYGVHEVSGCVRSGTLAHPSEEALRFAWKGETVARVNGKEYTMRGRMTCSLHPARCGLQP